MLLAAFALVGLSALGESRVQVQAAPRAWRAVGALQPRLSPDGETIAFAFQGAIWRMPRTGGVMRRLTTDPAWDASPAWSPDGKKIAFVSAGILQVIDAESGAVSPPAARVAVRGPLFYHPDGKRLLANARAGNAFELSWIDLASGALSSALEPRGEARVFALSPDGASIATALSMDVAGEQGGFNGPQMDVWIVAGGERRKLTRFASRLFDLAWNGGSLIGVSDLGGAHNDLWEIPLEAPEKARKLTAGQADEDAPSAAGSWLVYTDNREGATALIARDLSKGDERTAIVTGLDFGKPTGLLSLEFVEKGSGRPLAVRVAIQEEGGKPAATPGALYPLHDGLMDFSA
ncbi:MAG: PD40 domain-containing protein, partial [Planctomycetes bacterium]|nr:PD40 domain-containing protein [Planctomycetota bacterium]